MKDRAACTIFVSAIHPRIEEEDLFEFFSLVGRVEDIQLIRDQRTGKSKGLAYVEFSTVEDAQKSQVLNGQLLGGYPIQVQMPKTAASNSSSSSKQKEEKKAPPPELIDGIRIYVGSLNFAVNENDLRPIFEAFGPIVSMEIHRDSMTGQSKGFGFIFYRNKADGETAMAALDGYEVAGRKIKVGYATPLNDPSKQKQLAAGQPVSKPIPLPLPLPTLPTTLPGPIPGMGLPSIAAAQLPATAQSVPLLPSLPPLTPAQLTPSQYLLISNMFNPATETEPEWWLDLEEDVDEEAGKFGKIRKIHVDKDSAAGHVYIKFADVDGAVAAQKAFHGRWFANRQLSAEFIQESTYEQRFPPK